MRLLSYSQSPRQITISVRSAAPDCYCVIPLLSISAGYLVHSPRTRNSTVTFAYIMDLQPYAHGHHTALQRDLNASTRILKYS
jgi:hypothetical protein